MSYAERNRRPDKVAVMSTPQKSPEPVKPVSLENTALARVRRRIRRAAVSSPGFNSSI